MDEGMADLLEKSIENVNAKQQEVKPKDSNLLEIQKAAMTVQRQERDSEWREFDSYDYTKIPPFVLAKLYSALPLGPSGTYLTLPQCLALAKEQWETGKDPLKGHTYIMPSGRIGTSLEGMLIDLNKKGVKLGKPKFEPVFRDWPKGLILSRKEKGKEIDVVLDNDPGMTCTIKIDDEECEYTCWLTEWFVGGNPNWWTKMNWMLRIRSYGNCLKLGSGLGISEEVDETSIVKQDTSGAHEVLTSAPKSYPTRK
jgi:hypothetical protein